MNNDDATAKEPVIPNKKKPENQWLSFTCNLIVPIILLTKGKDWLTFLSATQLFVIAIAFPIGYFIYDLKKRGKRNVISIVGVVSVFLTGGIGLLELPPEYIIIKETAVPLVLGLVVVGSLWTPYPLVRTLLLNEDIINVGAIDAALLKQNKKPDFDKLLKYSTMLIAFSFLVSAILNFIVATVVVTADPAVDKELYNQQIGQMLGYGFLVIGLPTMLITMGAFWYLMSGLRTITGLTFEEIFPSLEEQKAD